jgi:excinuclease UvrABC nuclease subunit
MAWSQFKFMNSEELIKKYGIRLWCKLSDDLDNLKQKIPKEPGVYVFKLNKYLNKLRGKSDILYIGSSKNLRKRIINNYLKGRGGPTTKRIHSYLIKRNYINFVEVGWKITKNYKNLEKKLRNKFDKDHDQLPPWNRQG